MICERVYDLSAEQVKAYTSCKFASTITYSRAEVGEHFHGLHYKVSEGIGRDCIYVMVDRLTKYGYLFSIPS
jgi:hypothetical protein